MIEQQLSFLFNFMFCILLPSASGPLAAKALENFRNFYIKKFV